MRERRRTASGRKPKGPQLEVFTFKIQSVNPHYSFGVGNSRFDGEYTEHHHTELEAICLSPYRLAERVTRFVLIADRRIQKKLDGEDGRDSPPLCVGTLTMRGSRSEYLGSLPFDAALSLPALMESGAIAYIYLSGSALSRGASSISWMAFYGHLDPE